MPHQPDLFDGANHVDEARQRRAAASWSPPDLNQVARAIRASTHIEADAETTGLKWWAGDVPVGWAIGTDAGAFYLPTGHQGGGNLPESQVKCMLQAELSNKHITNINTKFDLHEAEAWDLNLIGQGNTFGDVAHHAALLDDNRMRFNLDQLVEDFLPGVEGKLQLDVLNKGDLWRLPAGEVAPYAIRDVLLVRQLREAFAPRIEAEDLGRVLTLEQNIIPVVVEMERNGAYLDVPLLEQWRIKAKRELEDQMWFVFRETGLRMSSPDSAKDLKRIFEARHIPFTHFTAHGAPSFTEEVLLEHGHDPVIKAVHYAGQLADLRSKYLEKYAATVRADGWIRFNLHQLRYGRNENERWGTVSGRFSSAGDEFGGFNVQQVVSADKQKKRGWCPEYVVRRLFLPQGGCLWLCADAKQIEYRIFAHYTNSRTILDQYDKDPETDYHDIVQELLRAVKADIQRKQTKITNFSMIFGAGLGKMAENLGVSAAEAAEVNAAYHRMLPEVKPLLRRVAKIAEERGYVRTILGRRGRFDAKYGKFYKGLSRVIQGGAADANKLMLVDLYRERHALGLLMRMTVHDELDADLRDQALLPRIQEFFNEQRLPFKVPILWELGIGPNWGDAKAKA